MLNPNQILLQEGDHSSSMYWVQSGQLVVTKKRGNEEVVLATFTAENW